MPFDEVSLCLMNNFAWYLALLDFVFIFSKTAKKNVQGVSQQTNSEFIQQ